MKNLTSFSPRFFRFTLALAVTACLALPALLRAQGTNGVVERHFDSPDAAAHALLAAAQARDRAAMHEILGTKDNEMSTGDPVQDKANFEHFTDAMESACVQEPAGENRIVLGLGTNDWPFAIPLVKTNGYWYFDTDAGREEIINRHIGGDELEAIGVCRAYVTAQQTYFSKDRDGSGVHKYAQKFKSTPGQKDGLYWDATDEPSPFSALVAEAHAEGYGHHAAGTGPHPFHGYLFRILTSQGRAAPQGSMNYLVHGNLTAGFALVAYPVEWGKSGIMTFIVNQDGKVYQRNYESKTARLAGKMTRYDPDEHWTLVSDQGFVEP